MQEVEQRTEEWFKKRVGRVTGSRAGAILGLSPWQTADDVLRAMVREYHGAPSEFVTNPAVEWGTKHERQAMLCFMRKTGLHVDDVGFLPYHDWLGASPDGITEDAGIAELKVPYNCRDGKPFKTLAEQPHYEIQVQLEIVSAHVGHGYFAQYRAPKGDPFMPDYVPEDMDITRIERRDITAELAELRAFYDRYLEELNNPAHLQPLRVQLDTDEARHIVNRIGEIEDAMHNLEQEKKDHLAKLVKMAGEKDAEVAGRKLTQVTGKKTVQYAKALKDLAPNADLTPYTSQGKSYWRIS